MADDLKDLLKKVLTSKGKKKFYFAYGLGKRKDNKGEGELAVSTKKPKKADIVAELADAGDVFEGFCWLGGTETSETVYFQAKGKKLSTTILTKMVKTAKTATGKLFDFQMPTPEEEAKADKLTEGEADQEPATAQPAQPSPQLGAEVMKRLNAMSGEIKAALAGPEKARVQSLFVAVNGLIKNNDFVQAGKVLDELGPLVAKSGAIPPASPSPTEGGAEVMKRFNALTGEIKAALAGPEKARVQSLFVAINGLIKNKDFVQVGKSLDELELLIRAAPPMQKPTDEAALSAEWERRVIALEPKVLEAQKKRAGEAKWMTMFMSVQDLGGEGQFAKALAVLDKLEGMLSAPPPGSNGASAGLEAALAQWTAARGKVIESLKALEGGIRAMNDPDGDGAIILVRAIQTNLSARPDTAKAVTELERYISTDQIITDAEGPNGFGIEIAIRSGLLPALAAVRTALPA